ncbi:MAG: hypothetical protein ACE37F_29950 [Nannocystaceae bacterium]|nr:hypothetical protein [bacterium]
MVFRLAESLATIGLAGALFGCTVSINSDEDTDTDTDAGSADSAETTNDSRTSGNDTASSNPTTNDPTTGNTSQADTSTGELDPATDGGGHDDCEFSEDFEGLADGDPWPSPWEVEGGVAVADVQGGEGRLQATIQGYSLARMGVHLDCEELDASVTFRFSDGNTQGAGLYGRTNGGYLRETDPPGEGYAAFSELFRNPGAIGAWREVAGEEQLIQGSEDVPLQANVDYRMRLRVTQIDAANSLVQGKIWRLEDSEPTEWTVERMDNTASLQGVGGGIALDAWSSDPVDGGAGADLFFDDLVVTRAR